MLIVTTDTIVGKEIIEVKGLKTIVGGELKGYNEMLIEARQIAFGRMADEAESLGANAIVGVRLMSSAVMAGAAEMVAYGTAVVVK